jgi:hypothetical protein
LFHAQNIIAVYPAKVHRNAKIVASCGIIDAWRLGVICGEAITFGYDG